MDIYISTATSLSQKGSNKDTLLLNGTFFGSMQEVKDFFEKWAEVFFKYGVQYSFEYYEETEDGQLIGESYEIRHPDFGN